MILTVVWDVTDFVETANVPDCDPPATVTVDGTVAIDELLASATLTPPDGATAPRVTVPVELTPPPTVDGLSVSPLTPSGFKVNVSAIEELPSAATIFALVVLETALVVIVNAWWVLPPAIFTLGGTLTPLVTHESLTTIPDVGAPLLIYTVPVDEEPPVTVVGSSVSVESVGALMVSDAVAELDPADALIFAVVVAATAIVVIANVADVAPELTSTDDAVEAFVLADESVTLKPLEGAFLLIVTVPVAPVPPATLAGDRESLETVWPEPKATIPRMPASNVNRRKPPLCRILSEG